MNNEVRKKRKSTKVIIGIGLLMIFIMYGLVSLAEILIYGKKSVAMSSYYNKKNCFSDQRVLTGAIDQFNMDHNGVIKSFDLSTYDLLVKENYIKKFDFDTGIVSEGDLSKDGYIYCFYHGSVDGRKQGSDENGHVRSKTDTREKLTKDLIKIAIIIGPTIIYYLISFI